MSRRHNYTYVTTAADFNGRCCPEKRVFTACRYSSAVCAMALSPSVTSRSFIKTAKETTPYDSRRLLFSATVELDEILMALPQWEREIICKAGKFAIIDNYSLYPQDCKPIQMRFSYSDAAVDKMSTDIERRAASLR